MPFSPLSTRDPLFEEVAAFYAWYVAWDKAPQAHAVSYQLLSQIMKVALLSQQGGKFLSPAEEEATRTSLKQLKEGLYNSRVKAADIPLHIREIYEKLTQNNSKAQLIGTLAQMEYRLGVNPEIHQLFQRIVAKINPSFPEQNATAITQNLTKILDKPLKYKNLNVEIQDALRGWL